MIDVSEFENEKLSQNPGGMDQRKLQVAREAVTTLWKSQEVQVPSVTLVFRLKIDTFDKKMLWNPVGQIQGFTDMEKLRAELTELQTDPTPLKPVVDCLW